MLRRTFAANRRLLNCSSLSESISLLAMDLAKDLAITGESVAVHATATDILELQYCYRGYHAYPGQRLLQKTFCDSQDCHCGSKEERASHTQETTARPPASVSIDAPAAIAGESSQLRSTTTTRDPDEVSYCNICSGKREKEEGLETVGIT